MRTTKDNEAQPRRNLSVRLTRNDFNAIDLLIKEGRYKNRSEVVEKALEALLRTYFIGLD
ncbi:MAG: hypothetical protein DRJ98_03790 [Thermoprotei archaeon]|nr:MAG: hypothetical protein DRJ98_03790 [Thermoprotei archaeon]RLF15130.1 MAG: hypothetical protein DRN06_06190 [Thermoprotei archaeon]